MKKAVILIVSFLLLTACGNTRVVDDLDLAQAIGFDLAEEGEIKGMFVIPLFKKEEQGKYRIVESFSKSASDAQVEVSKKAPRPIVLGQTRVVLLSEDVVQEKGIHHLLDFLNRDPSVGSRVNVAIVKGSVHEILYTKFKESNLNIGVYVSDTINQQSKVGNGPKINLQIFTKDNLEDNGNGYLPVIKKEKGEIGVSGIVLFEKERIVGRIPTDKMFVFKSLIERHKRGFYYLQTKEFKNIVLENIVGGSTYSVKKKAGKPAVHITIKIKGELKEVTAKKRLNKTETVKIEKILEKHLAKESEQLISKLQKKNIDPFGMKKRVHAQNKNLTEKKWQEMYPEMPIHVKAEVDIIQTGTIE